LYGFVEMRVLEDVDGGDESIAVTGDGDHEIVLIGTLPQRPPQRRDLTGEIVLVDDGVRPDAGQELIFADDVISPFEQRAEDVEGLRRDGDEEAVAPQPSLDRIDDERAKGIDALAGRTLHLGIAHVFTSAERGCSKI
jgi:hypothetical protein